MSHSSVTTFLHIVVLSLSTRPCPCILDNIMYYLKFHITLFISITMFCMIDGNLWNICHIQYE